MHDQGNRQVLIMSSRSLFRIAVRTVLTALDLDHLVDAPTRQAATRHLGRGGKTVAIIDPATPSSQDVNAQIRWVLNHPLEPSVVAVCSSCDIERALDDGRDRLLMVAAEASPAELVEAVQRSFGDRHATDHPHRQHLTPRQREILGLVASGRSNQEISRRLVIAPGTVKRHLNDTFVLLNARSRLDAVNRARSLGLI